MNCRKKRHTSWFTWANTKNHIRCHTFLLAIFPKLILISVEWKISNSAKTNIEVSFKKNPHLIPKNIFQKIYWREGKALFLVTCNIIISYIFPKTFIEKVFSIRFYLFSSIFFIFVFTCYKKTNNVSIFNLVSAVFWLRIILDRLLKNYIKLY